VSSVSVSERQSGLKSRKCNSQPARPLSSTLTSGRRCSTRGPSCTRCTWPCTSRPRSRASTCKT
jgi:hypothetical protein